VSGGSALIHEFYSREVPNPIHLTVDTTFRNGEATIKAFISHNLSLGDQPLAAQFQEIPAELRMSEAERVGCMHILSFFCLIINASSEHFLLKSTASFMRLPWLNGLPNYCWQMNF